MIVKAPFPLAKHPKYRKWRIVTREEILTSPKYDLPQFSFIRDWAATERRRKLAGFMVVKPYEEDESKRGRIVRMSKTVMKSIGCSDGDVVIVRSCHGRAIARCFAPPKNHRLNRESAAMNHIASNVHGIGGFVTVSKARGAVNATRIVLKPEVRIKRNRSTAQAIEKEKRELIGVPVTKGSYFSYRVPKGKHTLIGQHALVEGIEPKGRIGIIGKDTKIAVTPLKS